MKKETFLALIDKYASGDASEAEKKLVEAYYARLSANHTGFSGEDDQILQAVKQKLMHIIGRPDKKIIPLQRRIWVRYAAAAVLLFAIVEAGYLFVSHSGKTNRAAVQYADDVAPGREGAKLKLSDGRIILIDTAKDGLIAMEGNAQVYKENGRILYKGTGETEIYNEIITDRGRQWSASLPDGSTTWLNAESSLRYPLHFSGRERLIEMTGEASFKIVHDVGMPFRVKVKNQVIEDIGTEFNINAYDDETKVITTLIEGVASVATPSSRLVVKAGQEASVNEGSETISLSAADIGKAIAWRNGVFSFKKASIKDVMRQLSRWYNVDVRYEGNSLPVQEFNGEIGRKLTLKEVLEGLTFTNEQYRIEADNRIVIRP